MLPAPVADDRSLFRKTPSFSETIEESDYQITINNAINQAES
jgi:hypothetical protein